MSFLDDVKGIAENAFSKVTGAGRVLADDVASILNSSANSSLKMPRPGPSEIDRKGTRTYSRFETVQKSQWVEPPLRYLKWWPEQEFRCVSKVLAQGARNRTKTARATAVAGGRYFRLGMV